MVGWVRHWVRDESAVTAVEFSLVAVPFVFLLIGIIEMSLMFAASSTLHSATNDAARLIRTGQVQQASGDSQQMFEDMLCQKIDSLMDCTRLQYEVITMSGFADFGSFPVSYDSDGNLVSQGFDPGGVNDVILIRVVYRYPLMTPLLGEFLSDGPNSTKLLLATVVLETEPYNLDEVAGGL
jgi:Flp pilus assembly protein TadG